MKKVTLGYNLKINPNAFSNSSESLCLEKFKYLTPVMQTKVKPVILLISANPVKDLPHVEEEIKDITKVIRGKYPQPQEQIRVESIFNTNLEYLYQTIRFNRENIVIVHFAGHATNNALILNDGEYNSSFLSEELNRMPNLQLTFLNGCGTSSFVDKLNINNIIATKAEIPDYPAAQIASHFYEELVSLSNLNQAHNIANFFHLKHTKNVTRAPSATPTKKEAIPEWELYKRDDHKLSKTLQDIIREMPKVDPEIKSEEPSKSIRLENLTCHINRKEQDLGFLNKSQGKVNPLVTFCRTEHAFQQYLRRIITSRTDAFAVFEYIPGVLQAKQIDAKLRDFLFYRYSAPGYNHKIIGNQEQIFSKILMNTREKNILIYTRAKDISTSFITRHHNFWNDTSVPRGKQVFALLLADEDTKAGKHFGLFGKNPEVIIKKWKLLSESNDNQYMHQFKYLELRDLDNWWGNDSIPTSAIDYIRHRQDFKAFLRATKPLPLKHLTEKLYEIHHKR